MYRKLSHDERYLIMELSVTESLTDWCQAAFGPAACWQFQLGGQKKWQRHTAATALLLFVCFPFYSYKLYFLYVYAREALMVRSILLNSLFFFLTMSFKCINLYVKRTFSRTSACVRSNSDLVTLRTSQDLDWRVQQVGPIMFSSVLCSRRNSLQRSP